MVRVHRAGEVTMHGRAVALIFATLIALGAAGGCAREHTVREADEAAYDVVARSSEEAFGRARPVRIENGPSRNAGRSGAELVAHLAEAGPLPEELAESHLAEREAGLRVLDLSTALELARRNSREFQSEKETVYRKALSLTTAQDTFFWQYGLTGSVVRTVDGADRDRSIDTAADLSLSRQLMNGAVVAFDVGLTGVKYLNHELGTTLQNALAVSVSQPLWRGSDPVVVTSDLVQARHDVVYALRDFVRFEKEFAVDVASSYYEVLLQLDRVKNQWNNYKRRIAARERNELLAEAGRLKILEVDRARQSELQAHNSYLVAIQSFERRLDSFRLLLGLPIDAPVLLSREPLEDLAEKGIEPLEVDPAAVVEEALELRLDLKNTRGAVEDAEREVRVAADALKGDADFVGGINVTSTPDAQAGRFMFHEGLYEFGLEVDLPLKRLTERNTFRTSLIDYDAAVRSVMDKVDEVKQDVRDALRQLRRTRESYAIQKAGLELARRRVDGTQLEMDAGRATTRDLLEAQDALVGAENDLSEAMVSHRIATLEFLRDLELMEIDEQGQIHEGIDQLGSRDGSASGRED